MKDLRGKRALVTGAASGIGRCIALALAREGVALFVTDRDEAGLDAVSREAGAEGVAVETALCDLTDRAAISAMLSRGHCHVNRKFADQMTMAVMLHAATVAWRHVSIA